MNEWGVVTVVAALVALFMSIYTPIHNSHKDRETERAKSDEVRLQQEKEAAAAREANTRAITELTTSLRIFTEHFKEVEESNHASHEKIYQRLDEKGKMLASHKEKLEDHERRLTRLEEEDING